MMQHHTLESWLTLASGVAILIMGLRVYWLDGASRTNRGFAITCALLCLQNFLLFEMVASDDLAWAERIRPWQESVWNLASAYMLYTIYYYSLEFAKRQAKSWEKRAFQFAFWLTPIFVLLEALTPYGNGELVRQASDWYINLHPVDWYDLLRMGWVMLVYGLSVYFIYQPVRHAPHLRARQLRLVLSVIYGLIMLNTFYNYYIDSLFLANPTVLNEYISIGVGSLLFGLSLTNLQLFALHSRQALPKLLGSMTNWFIMLDEEFRVRELNEVVVTTVSGSTSDWLGKPIYEMIPMVDWNERAQLLRQLERHEAARFELVFEGSQGKQYVLFECSPLAERSNKNLGYVLVGTDWTVQKNALEQAEAYAHELELSNAALSSFAQAASHDLKEPVRNIGSFAGLARRRLGESASPDMKEYLSFIEGSARHMNELIERVLEISLLSRKSLHLTPIDLNLMVFDLAKQLSLLLRERQATMEFLTELPTIEADATLLRQLLQNLIENGLTFNESASPRILLAHQFLAETEECILEIHDNGIGIPVEFRIQIFEMFRRLHTRADYPGTGIGLAISQRIAQLHGGRLWVDKSDRLAGSVFYLRLPVHGKESSLSATQTTKTML